MTAPFPEGRTASWPIVTPELIEHHRQIALSERRTAIHAAMLWSLNQASFFLRWPRPSCSVQGFLRLTPPRRQNRPAA